MNERQVDDYGIVRQRHNINLIKMTGALYIHVQQLMFILEEMQSKIYIKDFLVSGVSYFCSNFDLSIFLNLCGRTFTQPKIIITSM